MLHHAKTAVITAVVLAASGFAAANGSPARATAPTVRIDMGGYLTTGSRIVDDPTFHGQLPVMARWHVTAPDGGICGETAEVIDTDGSILAYFDYHFRLSYPRQIVFPDSIYNTSYDNGDPPPFVAVSVKDCNGAIAQDSMSIRSGPREQDRPSATYSGRWTTRTCSCWSGGSAASSAGAGATVTFKNKMNGFGLVTDHAPGRGTYTVFVDGREAATISDQASTRTNRVVDFQTHFNDSPYANHVIRIEVVSGRVDVDLFQTVFSLPEDSSSLRGGAPAARTAD